MGVETETCNEFCNGAAVRIVVEDVPHKALVAGQIPIGLMSPDHEIFAKNISLKELIDRLVHPDLLSFYRVVGINSNGTQILSPIDYTEAVGGDLMEYECASGVSGYITYYPTANYYDLSDIKIETEQLPADWYNISYQAEYYARVESTSTPGQLNCIDPTRTAVSTYRFRMNHPGQVMEETVKLTPAVYMTDSKKSLDTTVEFYRPFTDALQDVFDEQSLLGSVNWVDYITPQFVPYLAYLLGLDLPYYPQSLYKLRKTMLRNVVRLQQLKGSRNAILDLFELFGYIVYINKLYWSVDGKRLIRPGEKLPPAYSSQEIQINEKCHMEPVLVAYNTNGFGQLTIPLLYRPAYTEEVQGIVNVVQGGSLTLNSYLIRKNTLGSGTVSIAKTTEIIGIDTSFLTDFEVGDTITVTGETVRTIIEIIDDTHMSVSKNFDNITSDVSYTYVSKTYKELEEISSNASSYCSIPSISTDGLENWSQVTIDKGDTIGNSEKDTSTSDQPTFIYSGVILDRKSNLLNLTFNGSMQFDNKYGQQGINNPDNELLLYSFAIYNREEIVVPDEIKDLYSNRFDIQLLTQNGEQINGSVLEFLIDYLFKIKAFHSLLNTIIYHASLHDTYQVTSFCVGGDLEQRYDIDAGKLQVPPAIIPSMPSSGCQVDPSSLGYKVEDIALRKKILEDLPEEFQGWVNTSQYLKTNATVDSSGEYAPRIIGQLDDERLPPTEANTPGCWFTYRGQDRLVQGDTVENVENVYDPTPITNTQSTDSQSTSDISPIDNIKEGIFYPTGADASTNNDSTQYSQFVREYSTPPQTFCELDGISDYCYKGRVEDEVLHTMIMMNDEQYKSSLSRLSFGIGMYYAYPSTQNDSIMQPMLQQPYDQNMPSKNNNFLGRLLRAYDTPENESIYYNNRQFLVNDTQNLLAIQRPNLGIQMPLMHFPGTRFASLNKLESNFVHEEWLAKPWDDKYSTSCGRYSQSCYKPTFLNAKLEVNTSGDEYLTFDSAPFSIDSNGLHPDIPTFGSHHDPDSSFTYNDVVHAIYSSQTASHQAITLDNMYEPTRTMSTTILDYIKGGIQWEYGYSSQVPTTTIGIQLKNLEDNIYTLSAKMITVSQAAVVIKVYKAVLDGVDIVCSECDTDDVSVHIRVSSINGTINATDQPLFSTATLCNSQGDSYYVDHIDGYPSISGYQFSEESDFDRESSQTDVFDAMGVPRNIPAETPYLFTFQSGIKYTTGYRADCGCEVVVCDSDTGNEIQVLPCSILHYQDDALNLTFPDGVDRIGYDYNPDKISTEIMMYSEESIGVHDMTFDGSCVLDNTSDSYRRPNMFELCDSYPTC